MDTLAAARYAAMRWNTPLSESHAEELLDHLDLTTATSIVDLGCGWGELLLRAAARTRAKVTGIDTDPAGLDRGRRAALDRGLDVTFVEQRAEDWRGTADRALCIGSSHTLGGTSAMLARLAEVVPRGRVLVGEGFWESPPTEAAHAIFGDDVLPLADTWPGHVSATGGPAGPVRRTVQTERPATSAAGTAETTDPTVQTVHTTGSPVRTVQATDQTVQPGLVAACRAAGWQVLHLSTASQYEWDDFESRHRAGLREWLLANPADPRAAEVRAEQDRREHEYLTVYRGVLGLAYLVLAR